MLTDGHQPFLDADLDRIVSDSDHTLLARDLAVELRADRAALRVERATSKQLREALTDLLAADETFRGYGPAISEPKYVVVLDQARDALGDVSAKGAKAP